MRRILAALAVSLTLIVPITRAAEPAAPIDVAICLDTSNSMDALIESAKLKLWTVVNDLAKIQPTPVLRVALYQYGNDNLTATTGWVRQEVPLTTDLDEIYKKLNALKTRGGTELVARVCRDAINDLKWSDDKKALRIIFVCGNEPANQDKEVTLESVAKLARDKGVYVNTIYCGADNNPESRGWKEFAVSAGGKYVSIDQNKSNTEVAIATPFDKEILELNDKLNGTYVAYGKAEARAEKAQNQAAQDSNAKANAAPGAAAPVAALDRASTKASRLYRNEAWDIVDRMKADKSFDVKKLKEEELSDELKKLTPEEREKFVQKKAAEREELQKKITDLSGKRGAFVMEAQKKLPKAPGDKAFDEAVGGALREQAAERGIVIPK